MPLANFLEAKTKGWSIINLFLISLLLPAFKLVCVKWVKKIEMTLLLH